MQSRKSTLLSIAIPVLIAFFYIGAYMHARVGNQQLANELSPAASSRLWTRSDSLFSQGKYQEALPGVLKLHANYPNNHIYIERAARIYEKLGDYQQAVKFWEAYFDRAPRPITACPQLGQAYWRLGQPQHAISAFQRCLALDPENTDSIFYLANALERSGDLQEAAALYERGLKLAPGYTDMQVGLARVWMREGRIAQANHAITRVLAHHPDNVDALLVAGLIFSHLGELEQARRVLERGVQLSPAYADFDVALANISARQKKNSVHLHDKVPPVRPGDPRVRAERDALASKL